MGAHRASHYSLVAALNLQLPIRDLDPRLLSIFALFGNLLRELQLLDYMVDLLAVFKYWVVSPPLAKPILLRAPSLLVGSHFARVVRRLGHDLGQVLETVAAANEIFVVWNLQAGLEASFGEGLLLGCAVVAGVEPVLLGEVLEIVRLLACFAGVQGTVPAKRHVVSTDRLHGAIILLWLHLHRLSGLLERVDLDTVVTFPDMVFEILEALTSTRILIFLAILGDDRVGVAQLQLDGRTDVLVFKDASLVELLCLCLLLCLLELYLGIQVQRIRLVPAQVQIVRDALFQYGPGLVRVLQNLGRQHVRSAVQWVGSLLEYCFLDQFEDALR